MESAWRQHDLLKKLDRGDLLSSVPTPDADAEVVAEGGGGNSRRTRKRARSPGRSEGEARGNGDGSAPSAAAPASPCGSDCSAGSFTSSSSSAGDSRAAPLSHIRYGLSRQGADSSADMLSEREMWALRKVRLLYMTSSFDCSVCLTNCTFLSLIAGKSIRRSGHQQFVRLCQ